MTTEAKFWAKVIKQPNGCWVYNGEAIWNGYRRVWFAGVRLLAHRFAYEMARGPIPKGYHINHLCHTNDKACKGGATWDVQRPLCSVKMPKMRFCFNH